MKGRRHGGERRPEFRPPSYTPPAWYLLGVVLALLTFAAATTGHLGLLVGRVVSRVWRGGHRAPA